KLMGATEMTLNQQGPVNFTVEDGAGTKGNIEYLYGDNNTHVLYAEGSYSGSLTRRPVRASCLLVLRSESFANQDGKTYVRARMAMFLDVKNIGIELIAKTFQSVIGKTTDQNFTETANFVTKLSRTTEANGPGIQRLATRLANVTETTRGEFSDHAEAVYEKAQSRQKAAQQTGKVAIKE
ncbi:MAG: hypothetical protein N2C12_14470, partial [Planctomycetales bacterium]